MKKSYLLLAVLIILGVITTFSAGVYKDWLWFGEVGYREVFWTQILVKAAFFATGVLIAFIFVYLNMSVLRGKLKRFAMQPIVKVVEPKEVPKHEERAGNEEEEPFIFNEKVRPFPNLKDFKMDFNPTELFNILGGKFGRMIAALVSLFIALFLAQGLLSDSMFRKTLLFVNRVAFGIKDPILGKDVSYFTNTIPFLEGIYTYAIMVVVATGLICVAIYFFSGMYQNKSARKQMFNHASVLLAIFFIIYAAGYYFRIADMMTIQEGVVFGPGYTQVHINLLYYRTAIVICLLSAVLVVIAQRRKSLRLFLAGPILLLAVGVFSVAGSLVVQNFIVSPNEIAKETKYLKNNIYFTRMAYGLHLLTGRQFVPVNDLTNKDLDASKNIISNIRIVDPQPSLDTYNQTQSIRSYYTFKDVDVDRYQLKDGYRQMFIAAREITPSDTMSWINQHIKYTHGYGIVASPVNRVTTEGQPVFLVKDIPPVSLDTIKVKRPEIYFGEYDNKYIITGANSKEFDYAQGDNNVEARYSGKAGINLSMFNRTMFALSEKEVNLLVSGELNSKSKIVLYRNIDERVKKIMPLLEYDPDSYMFVNKAGRLFWIKDAYTTSAYYPYSEPVEPGVNYIRNSVKVVIDAYNGDITYYVVDQKDPLAAAYKKAFPAVFKDFSQMPEDIRAHIRYPVGLFRMQAQILTKYHMVNPVVFYNKEDQWSIPNEVYGKAETPVAPYYAMLKLDNGEEFVLMLPLTPVGKNNMIAWMAARNDGKNYGELFLYKFPKRKLVYGPMQIDARINQNPVISSQLTLWGQQGSEIIRGNLFVIPINSSLLYVEPLYLQSNTGQAGNSIPEMKKVIVVYGDQVVMQDTLADALSVIFKGSNTSQLPQTQGQAANQGTSPTQLIERANQVYIDANNALKQGDWNAYGQKMAELQRLLEQLKSSSI